MDYNSFSYIFNYRIFLILHFVSFIHKIIIIDYGNTIDKFYIHFKHSYIIMKFDNFILR